MNKRKKHETKGEDDDEKDEGGEKSRNGKQEKARFPPRYLAGSLS